MDTAQRRNARFAGRATRPAAALVLGLLAALTLIERGASARGARPAPAAAAELRALEAGEALGGALGAAAPGGESRNAAGDGELPALLSQTGLYVRGNTSHVASENLFYVPQYPLWSDGATKRRWLFLPKGTRIDASDPDRWSFPIGTRFWKEFSFGGQRAETRYLERRTDGYRYGTYVWDAALGDARLAPTSGLRGVRSLAAGVEHDAPSEADCRACHEGRSVPVLGFNALQLSSDRDPIAPHREPFGAEAVDLTSLVRRGLLSSPPAASLRPRIQAPSAVARAAAGYLYGNCSSCHNASGSLAALGLDFDQSVRDADGHGRLLRSVSRQPSQFTLDGEDRSQRVVPGAPERSAVWVRAGSRDAVNQMPPLGTKLVDREAVRLLRRWILELSRHPSLKEPIE